VVTATKQNTFFSGKPSLNSLEWGGFSRKECGYMGL